MFLVITLGISLVFFECANTYVLLQPRKQDANHSNVDAFIQKRVPSENINKITNNIKEDVFQPTVEVSNEVHLPKDLITTAPKTFYKQTLSATKEPDLLDLFGLIGRRFSKGPAGPVFRTESGEIALRPKTVNLSHGTSSLYNLGPDTIIVAVKDLLSSSTFDKYLEKLSRKAAAVVSTVENDFPIIRSVYFE